MYERLYSYSDFFHFFLKFFMKTLAIETSCDDTSLAIVSNDNWVFNVDKIVMYSQIQQHIPFWWVLPEVASRLHSEKIVALIQEIWLKNIENVDFISVTTKPGLPWSLVVGRTAAYLLSEYYNKPLVEINHIHGHIFSILLERSVDDIEFPLVILTASWGHNDLYVVNKKLNENLESLDTEKVWPFFVTKVWYTLDDAAWEAFDKVSKCFEDHIHDDHGFHLRLWNENQMIFFSLREYFYLWRIIRFLSLVFLEWSHKFYNYSLILRRNEILLQSKIFVI